MGYRGSELDPSVLVADQEGQRPWKRRLAPYQSEIS